MKISFFNNFVVVVEAAAVAAASGEKIRKWICECRLWIIDFLIQQMYTPLFFACYILRSPIACHQRTLFRECCFPSIPHKRQRKSHTMPPNSNSLSRFFLFFFSPRRSLTHSLSRVLVITRAILFSLCYAFMLLPLYMCTCWLLCCCCCMYEKTSRRNENEGEMKNGIMLMIVCFVCVRVTCGVRVWAIHMCASSFPSKICCFSRFFIILFYFIFIHVYTLFDGHIERASVWNSKMNLWRKSDSGFLVVNFMRRPLFPSLIPSCTKNSQHTDQTN
jgi:hypothetical protein